jgi:hypothetical protein
MRHTSTHYAAETTGVGISLVDLTSQRNWNGLSWASKFTTRLEEHQKLAEEHSYVDYGVLPTFAVLHLLNDQKNFYSGAVAFQLFLSNFSLSPVACRHSKIATVYSFSLSGNKPILEELTAFENAYWLIRESSVNPASPGLTHPALAENLVVSVVFAACVDLEKRASSASVTHKAADLVNFRVFLDFVYFPSEIVDCYFTCYWPTSVVVSGYFFSSCSNYD